MLKPNSHHIQSVSPLHQFTVKQACQPDCNTNIDADGISDISPDEYQSTDSASLSSPTSVGGCQRNRSDNTRRITTKRMHSETSANVESEMEYKADTIDWTDDESCDQIPESNVPIEASEDVSVGKLTLWQFLLELLQSEKYRNIIRWTNRKGEFILIQAELVAKLWGMRKDRNHRMNYDKLSRALRYYYQKKILRKVHGHKFVYQFMGLGNCNDLPEIDLTKSLVSQKHPRTTSPSDDPCFTPHWSNKSASQSGQDTLDKRPTCRQRTVKQLDFVNAPLLPDITTSGGHHKTPVSAHQHPIASYTPETVNITVNNNQHVTKSDDSYLSSSSLGSFGYRISELPFTRDVGSILSSINSIASAFHQKPVLKNLVESDQRCHQLDGGSTGQANGCSHNHIARFSNLPFDHNDEVCQTSLVLPGKHPTIPFSYWNNPYFSLVDLYKQCEEYSHIRGQGITCDSMCIAESGQVDNITIASNPGKFHFQKRSVSPGCQCSCHILSSSDSVCSPSYSVEFGDPYNDQSGGGSSINSGKTVMTAAKHKSTKDIELSSDQAAIRDCLHSEGGNLKSPSTQLHHDRHAINMRRLGEQLTRLQHFSAASSSSVKMAESVIPSMQQQLWKNDNETVCSKLPNRNSEQQLGGQNPMTLQQQRQPSPVFTSDGQCVWMPVPVDMLQTWFHFLGSSSILSSPSSSFQFTSDFPETSLLTSVSRTAGAQTSHCLNPKEIKNEHTIS